MDLLLKLEWVNMAWHWLDFLIIGVIGLSVLTGLFRGFLKELIALCIWIVALWLVFHYSETFAPSLQPYIEDKRICLAVAAVIILLVTLIIGAVLNGILGFIIRRSGLSGTDRILGMGFGFVRGVFIVGLVMTVLKVTEMPLDEQATQSRLYAKFDPVVTWMSGFAPNLIQQVKTYDTIGIAVTATSGITPKP
jgi:membrane protein required for colicin V production